MVQSFAALTELRKLSAKKLVRMEDIWNERNGERFPGLVVTVEGVNLKRFAEARHQDKQKGPPL